jgi:hypothetical protein
MGMFDNYAPFEGHFKRGDTFTLKGIKLGALMNTVHGESQQVLMQIETPEGDRWFSAFGAGFVGQAQRVERGDLPARVTYAEAPPKQAGRSATKVLVPEGTANADGTINTDDIPF